MEKSNRIIKFRAWDNKEKKWLMGYEYPNLGGFNMFGECMLFEEWAKILNEFIFHRGEEGHKDLILMQYTGLKDKNRKEIYEGDILKAKNIHGGFSIYPVKWGECDYDMGVSGVGWLIRNPRPEWLEVIGNIYESKHLLENPELLNNNL